MSIKQSIQNVRNIKNIKSLLKRIQNMKWGDETINSCEGYIEISYTESSNCIDNIKLPDNYFAACMKITFKKEPNNLDLFFDVFENTLNEINDKYSILSIKPRSIKFNTDVEIETMSAKTLFKTEFIFDLIFKALIKDNLR